MADKKLKRDREGMPIVPPAPPLNPYVHLRRQASGLLRLEAVIHPDRKAQCQWQLLQDFCGTRVLVGKGGANTCFWMFGADGKRHVGFPHQLLAALDKASKQAHWVYRVEYKGKQVQRFSIRKTLKSDPPGAGAKIWGITSEGAEVVYAARPSASGKLSWIKTK